MLHSRTTSGSFHERRTTMSRHGQQQLRKEQQCFIDQKDYNHSLLRSAALVNALPPPSKATSTLSSPRLLCRRLPVLMLLLASPTLRLLSPHPFLIDRNVRPVPRTLVLMALTQSGTMSALVLASPSSTQTRVSPSSFSTTRDKATMSFSVLLPSLLTKCLLTATIIEPSIWPSLAATLLVRSTRLSPGQRSTRHLIMA